MTLKLLLTRSAILFVGFALLACAGERVEREVAPPPPATPTAMPTLRISPSAAPSATSPPFSPSPAASVSQTDSSLSLIIPVVGIPREQLRDTFDDARSEGRVHDAIDILAPQDTKVVAAMDGTIAKLFTSDKGGITIYQLSADQQFVFYYAHLNRYADGLAEKQSVRQGDLLGYVGDTGNAQPGNYHLHFAIWQITNPKSFWNGDNLNPYNLLRYAPTSR